MKLIMELEDNEKKVTFKENLVEDEPKNTKVTTAKASYMWKSKENGYCMRSKIVRSLDKNINLNAISTENQNGKSVILNPRYITLNPFSREEHVLAISDILDIDGNNLNDDKRTELLEYCKEKKDLIESDDVRFLYQFRIGLNVDQKDLILDDLLGMFLRSRLSICNYFIDENKLLVFDSEFLNPIQCCDEVFMFKYIAETYFSSLAKRNSEQLKDLEFKLENLNFYCMNVHTNKDDGLDNIVKYKDLFDERFEIPDTAEKFKRGYFIYKSNLDECHFNCVNNILGKLLKDPISKDI